MVCGFILNDYKQKELEMMPEEFKKFEKGLYKYNHSKAKAMVKDISLHGSYIEFDGKRIDPKDFYKPSERKAE